ncbi:MAG TPA: tryptophan synthase subunit alpha [bacterium]|nr:tryptophan synthase subunit alpha [bacterium]
MTRGRSSGATRSVGATRAPRAARRPAVTPHEAAPARENRLVRMFAEAKAAGRKVLIPYVMAGDPDADATERLVETLVAAGADAVELGVPFSDPIADGPVNQRAGFRALGRGMSLARALELVARIRRNTGVPLLFMSYYNLYLHHGLVAFCREAVHAGLDGVITADLPPEEGGDLVAAGRAAGLATVFLLAPTSTEERIRAVADVSTGFIYCVSRTGVTGVRDEVPADLGALVARIKAESETPVCVGFGISRPGQAKQVARIADGVIVGSVLVQMIEDDPEDFHRVGTFVRELKAAVLEA